MTVTFVRTRLLKETFAVFECWRTIGKWRPHLQQTLKNGMPLLTVGKD
jgi:hypothetical protein